eukprot:gnl/TRDRNA2_/TRDRNA2_144630_c0_seq1.p1 gnl/TRDRNA2_/TRDRNA2_144630_c0~~gnl/TRDRNA2_/TRDRNA2_144630_c0_seq1.p1  ORF type:complete len:403 (+),score=56.10 gnl/TRDRNA2_/TRDRNA2_144630_c0_seq1:27-1211(+)
MARDEGAWPEYFPDSPEDQPFGGFGFTKRCLLFVGLPLTLYISDSPHLYNLVRRLRGLALPHQEKPVNPATIRAALDHDGHPYAVLVYAIIAALQALHISRLPKGRRYGAMGLEGLSATAVSMGSTFGMSMTSSMKVASGAAGDSNLIFRGIWVPPAIDMHLASFSWSVNSFSRSLQGALWVLDFYADEKGGDPVTAALAHNHCHILIYVSRFYVASAKWVFPVQLFSAGIASEIEKEVIVPPFVHYEFETAEVKDEKIAAISTRHTYEARKAMLEEIEKRWDMQFEKQAPLLLRLLLLREYTSLGLHVKSAPTVTVLFVNNIKPAEPIRELFGDEFQTPEETLLAFPKIEGLPESDVFGANSPDLLDRCADIMTDGALRMVRLKESRPPEEPQ